MAASGRVDTGARRDGASPGSPDLASGGDGGDLAVAAVILATSLLPLLGAAVHVGEWGQGELGLAALGALFAGRELWHGARAVLAARRRS
jgi:hypothetical protein